MDDLSKYEALAKKGPWAGYWNLCAAILELVATVRELRKRYETKSNDMAVWKDRAEVAEHEHAIAAKTAEAAEAELDSYMRLHAATANIVLQRAEAAEAENAKMRELLTNWRDWWQDKPDCKPVAMIFEKTREALVKE
jgi:hypothetical protein